ncbi:MAG: glycosyl hydrolase [Dehalococcoidia bacterium]
MNRSRLLAGGIGLITALCLLGSAGAVSPASAKTGKAKQQQRPLYWGAWIGSQITGTQPPWDMSAVTQFETMTGKGLSLIEFSAPFADCKQPPCTYYRFPTGEMEAVRAYGAIPFFSWSSAGRTGIEEPDFRLANLIAGAHDPYIRSFAEAARNWGHPFFLRFNWEMNGNWFPWSEGVNGNGRGEYVAAWRHVRDIFTSVGATNATWVWCPYADPRGRFKPLRPLYPGDAYVDWTCLDGFNWARSPANPAAWMSFGEIFRRTYRQIVTRIAPRKPMLLAEFASTGGGRAKAAWIRNMFKLLRTEFRRIRGLIWFNQIDRGTNWPLESSPAAARAFRQGVRRGYRPNIYSGLTGSPIPPSGRIAARP